MRLAETEDDTERAGQRRGGTNCITIPIRITIELKPPRLGQLIKPRAGQKSRVRSSPDQRSDAETNSVGEGKKEEKEQEEEEEEKKNCRAIFLTGMTTRGERRENGE